jgi:hypothetical protein
MSEPLRPTDEAYAGDHAHEEIHLPAPSAQPILVSLGAAMLLAGLVPDSLLWKMTWMSVGGTILAISVWLWVSDAVDEYRDLPD